MMVQKPYAVFDIDGTLIRWQLYHSIVDRLVKNGQIDANAFAGAKAARMIWKNRTSDTDFGAYQKALIEVYDQAIRQISYQDYLTAVNQVFDEYKDQSYTFTRDLIGRLKAKNYLLFAVSGSQVEIVEIVAKHYGFDDWAGSVYHQESGKFSGQKTILAGQLKVAELAKLIKKHGAGQAGSVAVGDTDGDIAVLEAVKKPIAFNPNKKLFDHARQHGWQIVVERKNMVYELEPGSDGYKLA